jgi:hypothetical protein
VSGELEAAGTTIPLAFDTSVRVIDGELELEVTTTVDQRRIGMSQGPLRNRPTVDEAPREDAPRARTARISLERDEADATTGVSGKQARRGHTRVA